MEVVKLTPLGSLTLGRLLELEEQYKENAEPKRKKLAKLWGSTEEMAAFIELFSAYHSPLPNYVISRNDQDYLMQGRSSDTKLDPEKSRMIPRYQEMGLVAFTPFTASLEETIYSIQEETSSNPAKNIEDVYIELTGLCNLKCKHCYRGGSRSAEYGLTTEKIKAALEPLLRAGVRNIYFTGGEPTLRKEDILEIIDYACQFMELHNVSVEEKLLYRYGTPNPTVEDILKTDKYIQMRKQLMRQLSMQRKELIIGSADISDQNTLQDVEMKLMQLAQESIEFDSQLNQIRLDSIGIFSNAFFEDQRDFVRKIKPYGNVHLQVSLDSFNGHRVNMNRGRKGVYRKIKELATITAEEGLELCFTAHDIGGTETRRERENKRYFTRSGIIYSSSGMLQIGNATGNGFGTGKPDSSNSSLGSLSSYKRPGKGWCTGWTLPRDIHIKPTGIVGNCLYAYAVPEEFGNLYQSSMTNIINGIQNSRVYAMFTDGRIQRYQQELDRSLFPTTFKNSCEPMVITLTYGVIKERLMEQGVENPIQRASEETARAYKYIT